MLAEVPLIERQILNSHKLMCEQLSRLTPGSHDALGEPSATAGRLKLGDGSRARRNLAPVAPMTTYKHLPHPAPPKPRGSKSETALEEMMDRRFKANFDKLFRSNTRRSPVRRADDIDARLERALVLAKRIGDARRQHQADRLHKARALRAEAHKLLAKCDDLDLEVADISARLDRLELERLMEN